jgi:FAD/FMN-containing dehydrogenase
MAADLREQLAEVRGPVLTNGDPGYDESRSAHNGMFDKKPKAIVRAEQVADVVTAVNCARDNGLELAIKGGGHSAPGFGTTDGGLLIDLSLMRHVHVDPRAKTARASGGATWGDFNYATHAYGLATTGGIVSTTGVGGLTLGGGIGYLTRGHGLTIDNLVSADIVTADGKIVTASEKNEPELFWAIRGGGGNFGVVTSFELALHELSDVYVGIFFYEMDVAPRLLRMFDELIRTAPRELGGYPGFHRAPPLPFIPEDRHGDPFCVAIVHWAGAMSEGEKAMQPFRDLAPRVGEMVTPMPYPALNGAFDPIFPAGNREYWKGCFAKDLSEDAIAQYVKFGGEVPEVSTAVHLYPVNGAAHDKADDSTAFPYRSSTYSTVIYVAWTDPSKDADRINYVREFHAALEPYSEPAGYINFMSQDDEGKVAQNYAPNYARLQAAKRNYDPDNLFHVNQNIKPA